MIERRTKFLGIFIFIVLLVLFTQLLINEMVEQDVYLGLITVAAVISCVIFFSDRVKEVNFKESKIILSEIQKAKEEVFAKQQEVREIARLLAKILAFSSKTQGRYNNKEGYALWHNWYQKQLEKVSKIARFTDDEKGDIFKISNLYEKFDDLARDGEYILAKDAISPRKVDDIMQEGPTFVCKDKTDEEITVERHKIRQEIEQALNRDIL